MTKYNLLHSTSTLSSLKCHLYRKRVQYGAGLRRVILLELSDLEVAQKLRELLHEQPCELLGRCPMYVEFALPRKEQEFRDRLLRVHHVLRDADSPERRRENGAHWAHTIRARQVQHFGYTFNYDTRRCEPMKEPIPQVLQSTTR
ncbi:hypothetical protein DD238_003463 [Peronospora effusa]|uniref:Uncharacterized protein n=1 Tax=Peronospora effusa TaxID=542832 RepID=A0A3M6VG33_9STRA|nr:hypothetical protein DD238_003463 [Peronospora effusa]